MHQNTIRGPPSSKLALVATALLGVTVGILLAPSTCDSTRDGDNPPNVKFQKRDSCLLELSDGRWELATSGYVEDVIQRTVRVIGRFLRGFRSPRSQDPYDLVHMTLLV